MDEALPRSLPSAGTRVPGGPEERIHRTTELDAPVPAHTVAAAFLAVLRKYSGHNGFEIQIPGRGPLGCLMPAERTLSDHIGNVAALMEAVQGPTAASGIAFSTAGLLGDNSGYDLLLWVEDGPSGLVAEVHADAHAGVFDEDAVDRTLRHTIRVLRQISDTPDAGLADLDLLVEAERQLIRGEFSATRRDYPRDSAIYPMFAEQVAERPDQPAVVYGDGGLTYRQLDERAAALAAVLGEHGVGRGDRVALMFGKVPDWIVATLAVLRAGAAFVPIDPGFPAERRDFMLRDSGVRALIAAEAVDAPVECIQPAAAAAAPCDPVESRPTDGAYVMYTSGTTGNPKGVLINQRAVVRLVRNSGFADLSPDTRILQTGAVGFDATTFEVWGSLLNGGTLILVPDETILDPSLIGHAITEHRATTLWLTAPLFHQLVDQDAEVFRPVREVLVGGDVLSPRHLAKAMETCPDLRIINGYGPTENTTFSTAQLIREPPTGRIPIGAPIANSTAVIVDLDGHPQPFGVPGELLVGGDGLSDGYLNRPELDVAAFTHDPFGLGERLYRTGDLARRLPTGAIDFLGRLDQQVKVRGFRVEPGEVEHRLTGLAEIREAAVIVRSRPGGIEKFLCAYYTADREPGPGELQAALRAELPDHMVPAEFIRVPEMPLNRNGKIDRAALAELSGAPHAPGHRRAAPRDDLERVLTALWQDALGIAVIGVTDNLFDLGVTSLTAAVFAVRARKETTSRLSAAEVLARPTIEALARAIRGSEGMDDGMPALVPAPRRALYPLSPQQRSVYVEQLKDLTATHYNVPVLIETADTVDRGALQAALDALVARHESLRTTFVNLGGNAFQRVHDDMRVVVEELPGDSPEALGGFLCTPDLTEGPLVRVGLHHRPGHDVVLFDLHHVIADGITVGILLDDLSACLGGDTPDEPTLQYKDYAVWRGEAAGDLIAGAQGPFWRKAFAGLGPRPDLPTDFPRPAMRSVEGARHEFDFGAARGAALERLGRSRGVTTFHVLLALHFMFLAQVTGGDDITTGTPVGGRVVQGTERIAGMFANTLCLRARIRPEQPFADFLRDVGDHALAALAHQDYPFERLVEDVAPARDYSRNPLFDAMIGFQDASAFSGRRVLGGVARAADTLNPHTMFDLNLQVYELDGDWHAVWAHSAALFHSHTVRAFAQHLLNLADAVVTAPDRPLGDLIGRTRTATADSGIDFAFSISNES